MPIPTLTEIAALENEVIIELPNDYHEFINQYDGYQEYEHPATPGKEWQLAALLPANRCSSILDPSFVDGNIKYWQQSVAWADMIEEYTGRDWTKITNSRKRFKLDRLRACITIAEENGDFLLLDPMDNFSVWIYWHDGDDVQRIADSFANWLEKSTPTLTPASNEKTAPELSNQIPQYCGLWVQKTQIGDFTIAFSENGSVEEGFSDELEQGHWRVLSTDRIGVSIFESSSKSEEVRYKVLKCTVNQLSLFDLKHKNRTDWVKQGD